MVKLLSVYLVCVHVLCFAIITQNNTLCVYISRIRETFKNIYLYIYYLKKKSACKMHSIIKLLNNYNIDKKKKLKKTLIL